MNAKHLCMTIVVAMMHCCVHGMAADNQSKDGISQSPLYNVTPSHTPTPTPPRTPTNIAAQSWSAGWHEAPPLGNLVDQQLTVQNDDEREHKDDQPAPLHLNVATPHSGTHEVPFDPDAEDLNSPMLSSMSLSMMSEVNSYLQVQSSAVQAALLSEPMVPAASASMPLLERSAPLSPVSRTSSFSRRLDHITPVSNWPLSPRRTSLVSASYLGGLVSQPQLYATPGNTTSPMSVSSDSASTPGVTSPTQPSSMNYEEWQNSIRTSLRRLVPKSKDDLVRAGLVATATLSAAAILLNIVSKSKGSPASTEQ